MFFYCFCMAGLLKHGVGSHHAPSQELEDICQDLHCRRDHYTWTSHPALEGTTCGHRKVCKQQEFDLANTKGIFLFQGQHCLCKVSEKCLESNHKCIFLYLIVFVADVTLIFPILPVVPTRTVCGGWKCPSPSVFLNPLFIILLFFPFYVTSGCCREPGGWRGVGAMVRVSVRLPVWCGWHSVIREFWPGTFWTPLQVRRIHHIYIVPYID